MTFIHITSCDTAKINSLIMFWNDIFAFNIQFLKLFNDCKIFTLSRIKICCRYFNRNSKIDVKHCYAKCVNEKFMTSLRASFILPLAISRKTYSLYAFIPFLSCIKGY